MTEFTSLFQDSNVPLMTGREVFPILCRAKDKVQLEGLKQFVASCIKDCEGLNPYWDCLQKAHIVKQVLGGTGVVVLGSCIVWNHTMDANYGYEYNMPYEFHAWWQKAPGDINLIDIALPGVISRGLITLDDKGPILTERTPSVLVGIPPMWIQYTARAII